MIDMTSKAECKNRINLYGTTCQQCGKDIFFSDKKPKFCERCMIGKWMYGW